MQECERNFNHVIQLTHAATNTVGDKVASLLQKNKELEKQLQVLESKMAGNKAKDLWTNIVSESGVNYLFEVLENTKQENMRTMVDNFQDKFSPGIIVIANHAKDDKVQLICSVSKCLSKDIKAGDVIKNIAAQISGRGGGRPDFAQGGGVSNLENLKQVFANSLNDLRNLINN